MSFLKLNKLMLARVLAYSFTQKSAGGHDHEIVSEVTGGRALKKPAREPRNERKGFMVVPITM